MIRILIIFLLLHISSLIIAQNLYFPINIKNRQSAEEIKLTEIGKFGLWRIKWKANAPHFHTGCDIKRPGANYLNEPIFSVANGRVISVRNDGANSQVIIEHQLKNKFMFWSVYEHVMAVMVRPGDYVEPLKPIARFMTKEELAKFGWHFDHVHLEIMKLSPLKIKPSKAQPNWLYVTYSLSCFTEKKLHKYYYNPLKFVTRDFN